METVRIGLLSTAVTELTWYNNYERTLMSCNSSVSKVIDRELEYFSLIPGYCRDFTFSL